ncbi:nucleoside triphosphate pyrophosphohydrolase [Hoyosella altamirensis]|uniref:Putative house-cleaning noncanonical NTP pyrophosphatase (MazG superfamily) n=1 Tax=Hoyosella altamirensis TaxID=616997 RepID=A0A839RJW9_9ACTN|nr:nucleoside triphosphate pyrophosphohydrolase [Hoyosella altamirensis]MBB3036599.1 putative house-cleaning noncanonical NTP pyrophosphatase (MazG superfamily) [Hoyosella altamirensis]
MGKLVRDKIPALIRASGRMPSVRVLNDNEFAEALHDKLIEEVAELREADSSIDCLAEASDVLEVLKAIVGLHGFDIDDVVRAAAQKATDRGAFVDRLWLDGSRHT